MSSRPLGRGYANSGRFAKSVSFHWRARLGVAYAAATATSITAADHAAAESLMRDFRADRETVAGPKLILVKLAVAVIDVRFARRRIEHRLRSDVRSDSMHQAGRDFIKKARRTRLLALAVKLARERVGQIEQAL